MQVASTLSTPPLSMSATPHSNTPSTLQSNTLGYIAHDYELQEVAYRLKWQSYRGAISGPAGCGKSIMLQALGDELMHHGLTPLPLMMKREQRGSFPKHWQRVIRQARPTDALLLDGYGYLPYWARVWVWFASLSKGAVVVTAERNVAFPPLAKPRPSVHLLEQLIADNSSADQQSIDAKAIYDQAKGNLNVALDLVEQLA